MKNKNGYPMVHERWYARQLNKFVDQWNQSAKNSFNNYIKPYVKQEPLKFDDVDDPNNDPNWFNRVQMQIDLLGFTLDKVYNQQNVESVVSRFVKTIDQFSYNNVKMKVGIYGIDPISDSPALKNYTKSVIHENVSLIKSMYTNYHNNLEKAIYRSLTTGSGVQDITDTIVDQTRMTRNHAKLIANDQTGTVVSKFNTYRAKGAGAEKYIWHSMEDNRVRPRHQELDGQTFKIDDPGGGDNGQMPGEPIRCRCYAEYLFDDDE